MIWFPGGRPRGSTGAGISTTGSGGGGGSLPAHPRIWMNATRSTKLALQKSNNTALWQRVQTIVNNSVAAGTGYSAGNEEQLYDLGLAYIAGGTNTYSQAQIATRAEFLLNRYCVTDGASNLTGLRGDSAYYYRFLGYIICGLDWNYAGLTTGCRQAVATWLMDAADWVWPDSNSSRTGGWAVTDPGNNYFYGFMYAGLAALAASGDDTGTTATSPGSGSDRPAYHYALVQSKWNALTVPHLDLGAPSLIPTLAVGGAKGGLLNEGQGYGWAASGWFAAEIADGYATCGITLTLPNWLLQAATGIMHFTTPNFYGVFQFGDGDYGAFQSRNGYRAAMQALQDAGGADSTARALAKKWYDSTTTQSGGEYSQGHVAKDLLRYDPSVTAASDLSSLPKYFLFEGAGYFVYRDSWTDTNSLMFSFDCGDIGDGHRPKCAGALAVFAGGDWVTGSANIYSASGIESETKYYNSLEVGVAWNGQTGQNSGPGWNSGNGDPNGGYLTEAPSIASDLVYLRGQMKNAYGAANVPFNSNRDRVVSNCLRTVVYIPSKKTFIIVDQVTHNAGYTSNAIKAYWHSKTAPSITGQAFKITAASGSSYYAYGNALLPSSGLTVASVAQPVGPSGATSSYATRVTSATGGSPYLFVTTIVLSTSASEPFVPTASSDGTNITAVVDNLTVTIPLDGTSAVTIA